MRFDEYEIDSQIKNNLEEMGFKSPTDIQYKTIPCILRGEDVLAIAQTGTGKTAAFAIPIIHKVHSYKKNARRVDGIKCLVMVPTHELARQITTVINDLSQETLVTAMAMYGGVDQAPQIAQLEEGADILVTTPGRMFDLHHQGHLRLHRIEILVLDEADHMLDMGFIKDIRDVLRHLPKRRQTLFFSATINKKIKKTAYSLIKSSAIRIQISPNNPIARSVYHQVAFIEMEDKRFFLERLYRENKKAKILVFVRTRVRAERVKAAMERVGIDALAIHGEKDQKVRTAILNQFRENQVRILVATDVSARGIDIPDVTHVVNYDMPEPSENYVHRVGRTGRGMRKGYAISFCAYEEELVLKEIEEYLGQTIERLHIDDTEYQHIVDVTKDTKGVSWKKMAELEIKKAEEDKRKYSKKPNKKKKK